MKQVDASLTAYLNTQKQIQSCDLYDIILANSNHYYYTDADIDINSGGTVYQHGKLLFKRQQIKLNSTLTVDTLSVTIYAGKADMIESKPVMKAALDGTMDRARLHLKRCFFRDGAVVGTVDLFAGKIEIKNAGGLQLQLSIKAETSGLNMNFPIRKYYPQGSFSTGSGGVVTASSTDSSAVIAPYIPRKEVLL